MKRVFLALLLTALLACGAWLWSVYGEITACRAENQRTAQAIQASQQQASKELMDLQEDLALWYNLELEKAEDAGRLEAVYGEILDWGGQAMGSMEFPDAGVQLPVYHGKHPRENGLTHVPQSGFPVGSRGNHCVLLGQSGLSDGDILFDISDLEVGDTFVLHVLRERIVYRVEEKKTAASKPSTPAAEPGKMLCTLLIYDGEQWTVLRGSASE